MDKEQILALAEKCGIFPRLTPAGTDEVWSTKRNVESFFDAAIESYKAELLKEAGEPEYFRWDGWDSGWVNTSKEEYDSIKSDDDKWMLYPSDQVAAAIIKATKTLEGKLAAAQEEMDGWRNQAHQSQSAFDRLQDQLTKAEQGAMEWQPIETAPKDGTVFLAWRKHATHPLMVRYEPSYDWFANYDGEHVYDLTHWMPLPKAPNGASS